MNMQEAGREIRKLLSLFTHLTSLLLLLVLSYRLLANLRFLAWVREQGRQQFTPQPRVSILVPARNEAATITPCITSLLQQEYPAYEVIVLDDGSTDSTGAQLDTLAAADPRLRVIHAKNSLPPGWNGKSYACHRLAAQASGEWLLFTDADTLHTRQSLALGVAQALALDVDMLSAFPAQETRSWSERIFVSFIVDFLPLAGLDFRSIYRGEGSHSAGNGQYLLLRAASYHAAGGHLAIYNETLDDFALARRLRQRGYRTVLTSGQMFLRCRMYRSAGQVWEGFSRSLMHGLELSSTRRRGAGWAALFAWGYSALFVHPFLALYSGRGRGLAVIEVLWLALLRAVVNRHLHRPLLEIFTTPLAAWGVMILGCSALYRRWRGQTINWKGRAYMG